MGTRLSYYITIFMLSKTITLRHKDIVIDQDLSLSHAGTVWDGALVLAYFWEQNESFWKLILQLRKPAMTVNTKRLLHKN